MCRKIKTAGLLPAIAGEVSDPEIFADRESRSLELELDVLRAGGGIHWNANVVGAFAGRYDVAQQGRIQLTQAPESRPVIEGDTAERSAAGNRQRLEGWRIVELDRGDSIAVGMVRDISHGHEASHQPAGSPRQAASKPLHIASTQRP